MAKAYTSLGAPRIHGELLKLGIDIGERSVSRFMPPKARKPPSQTWRTFLDNHVGSLSSIDFFTVHTATFRVLYVFLVLSNDRRRVLHWNVTSNPGAQWTAQQIVEAFPEETAPEYMMRDRDGIYGDYFRRRVESFGIEEVLSAPRSPWQNPYVERLLGSIRRDCLDHVIVLSERHLRRVLTGRVGGWRGPDFDDADVSILPPEIPYGGFSPVRLQGWPFWRCLPNPLRRLSLLPACSSHWVVCIRRSCPPWPNLVSRSVSGRWLSWTPPFERPSPLYPRGPRSGPGCSVPVHRRLFGPIRPTRRHDAISRHCRLFASPSPCGSALAAREWFRAFAVRSFPACRPLRPRSARRLHVPSRSLHRRQRPSPKYGRLGALDCPAIRFGREYDFGVPWFARGL